MMKKLLATLGILILLLGVASVAFAAKSYRAERFDANWQVNEDGSLTVVETVVFNFSGGPFTFVYRELRDDNSDGIQVQSVMMDGQPMSAGEGAGQYEISGRGDQKVTWHFAPTADSQHTFELRYRVLGAVRREGGDDLLYWHFLPTDYEYAIDSATLVVSYPAAAVLISKPDIRYANSSLLQTDRQVKFTALGIEDDTRIPASLRFAGGSVISAPPQWQQRQSAIAERAPMMWLAAALVLALGGVFLASVWRAGRRDAGIGPEPRSMTITAPPSDLAPALAGALVNYGGKAGNVQAMATLFRLAQAGVLVFEEIGEKKWYRGAQFRVRLEPRGQDSVKLQPHEQALIDGLFKAKGKDELPLSELAGRLQKAMGSFSKTVDAELTAAGLRDDQRAAHAQRLMMIGLALLALLIPAGAAAAFLVAEYGGWALLIPAAVFLLSMAAFIMSGSYSSRSAAGEAEAAAWRGFKEYLQAVIKGREPNWDARLFDRYFPYAATFNVTEGWAKAFRDQGGGEAPAWFRSLAGADEGSMAAFVVMTSAVHSSTVSSSGAGGGGAGGGGGSGAG